MLGTKDLFMHKIIWVNAMSKLDEFKEFCKEKHYLIDRVKSGKTSWQELYEIYDIYGPDADDLKEQVEEETATEDNKEEQEETKKEDKREGLGGILDLLSGFDPDKLSEGLSGVKKILSVLSEVTKPEDNEYVTKRKMTRPYQRSDD